MWTYFAAVLILIRHGQSTANAQSLLVGRTDAELTDRGRDQARALAHALVDVEVVLSSPLRRARETAELALAQIPVEIDESFIEQDYGLYDGRAMAEVAGTEWNAFRSSHEATLGDGESLADVDDRVHLRLEQWRNDPSSLIHDARRHIAVVSHVSPIKSAVAWALGVHGSTAWHMRLDNASITTIAVRESGPYLVTFNDVSARAQRPSLER
jgi:broad specificity phosphatase PhoE